MFVAGIGWATTITMFFVNCYYCIILCWAFYYMFASFTNELPWESCDNYWNTDACSTFDEETASDDVIDSLVNGTVENNVTMTTTDVDVSSSPKISAVTEFWEYAKLYS